MPFAAHLVRQVRWPRAFGLAMALFVSSAFWSLVALLLRSFAA